MIVGVGVDVVPVERFAQALDRTPGLAVRVFTPAERELPVASLAARFAAKEAVAKALGVPAGMEWHDCEVIGRNGTRPRLELRGTVQSWAAKLGIRTWHLSLSHDGGMAVAMVVAEA
ncbi:MAG: holo-ACP synthase [Streptosporangiales bacterium]|nr:holo-ACP synthase [Streptosporangiales bacterium]